MAETSLVQEDTVDISNPFPKFDQYFTMVDIEGPSENLTMIYQCKSCDKKIRIKKNNKSSSNLSRHLIHIHKQTNPILMPKKRKSETEVTVSPVIPVVRPKVKKKPKMKTSNPVNDRIINFFVRTGVPFELVEHDAFQNLFDVSEREDIITSVEVLKNAILQKLLKHENNVIIRDLQNVEFVGATVDAWRHLDNIYVGIAGSWLDAQSLKRKVALLAIKQIDSIPTLDSVGQVLQTVFHEYEIVGKVVSIMTDNSPRFVKMLYSYSKGSENIDEDDIEILPINSNNDKEWIKKFLPALHRCPSTILNKIVEDSLNDSNEIWTEDELDFVQNYNSMLDGCKLIWKEQYARYSDVKDTCGTIFKRPIESNWHCYFVSLQNIIQNETQLSEVTALLGIPNLTALHITLMKEYVEIMKPIAFGLEILQSVKNCHFGIVYTVITQILSYLDEFSNKTYKHCTPLVNKLKRSINTKFKNVFDSKEHVIAAALNPFCLTKLSALKDLVLSYILELTAQCRSPENETEAAPTVFSNGLFDSFFCTAERKFTHDCQIYQYLSSPGHLSQYPCVRRLFLKYNTPIPASACLEHCFKIGKTMLTYQHGRLLDDTCELVIST